MAVPDTLAAVVEILKANTAIAAAFTHDATVHIYGGQVPDHKRHLPALCARRSGGATPRDVDSPYYEVAVDLFAWAETSAAAASLMATVQTQLMAERPIAGANWRCVKVDERTAPLDLIDEILDGEIARAVLVTLELTLDPATG